jgi:DNA-binding response OmpR family regulator
MSSSLNLLVVEDTLDTRDLLQFYFTRAGYNVSTANDGQEGLNMTKAEKPDLILTDVAMPNMDGVEMIREIRSESEFANIPIIVFTARSASSNEEILAAGANRIFHKPFDFDEVQKEIRGLIGQSDKLS